MSKEKRGFMAHLKRIYKEDREPEVKGLRNELKKRRMEFYTRDDGKKRLVIIHRAVLRRGESPQGREWPNHFRSWKDDKEDMHETYLIWSEELGAYPIACVESIRDFLIDEEDEEEDVSYR